MKISISVIATLALSAYQVTAAPAETAHLEKRWWKGWGWGRRQSTPVVAPGTTPYYAGNYGRGGYACHYGGWC
jgi:hypothetical protein